MTRSEKHFEWLLEVIRLAEAWDVTLKTHIFITEKEQNYDLRTLMRFLLESKLKCPTGRSLFTGLRAETHFGRPKFNELLELIMQENPSTGKIGVFRNDFNKTCSIISAHAYFTAFTGGLWLKNDLKLKSSKLWPSRFNKKC